MNVILPQRAGEEGICGKCSRQTSAIVAGTNTCYDCNMEPTRHQDLLPEKKLAIILGQKVADTMTFEKFKPIPGNQKALESAKKFNHEQDNLYIFGLCGTGKTHLACAIAHDNYMSGKTIAVLKPRQIIRNLRGTTAHEESIYLSELIEKDILVIDELGLDSDSSYAIGTLCEIIERRENDYKNGLIVTSNLSLDELAKKLSDDRLPSRLNGICRKIKIESQDMRGKV